MSFDDAARQAADALGTEVSRALQEQLDRFVALLSEAAARERITLTEQAQQAVQASEETLQDAVASARTEATHDAEVRFEAALAERAALAEAATAAVGATHDAERAGWADRAPRLQPDLTERQERDADLVARAQRAEMDLLRAQTELAARTENLAEQLAEQTSRAAQFQADAERAIAAADAAAADAAVRPNANTDADADPSAHGAMYLAGGTSAPATSAPVTAASTAASADALERLVSGFRTLDEGRSLSQLLDSLAVQAARHASRAAIFVVRGQPQQGAVLQGWAFSGFNGAPLDARSLSVPLDKLPALADVVMQGGRSDVHTAGFAAADVNPLAFMSVPRTHVGVAVPVLVGGQVAAVVYGDDGGSAAAAREIQDGDDSTMAVPASAAATSGAGSLSWADALELLARHAARCLEAQTAIRAARLSSSAQPAPVVVLPTPAPADASANGSASAGANGHGASSSDTAAAEAAAADAYAEEHARRYARLLIADIRLYNEAAVRAGREHRDLWHRLQPDIARARRAFEDRVTEVADRERLFDEELVRTLADGDESLLGFDLMGPKVRSASATERLAV